MQMTSPKRFTHSFFKKRECAGDCIEFKINKMNSNVNKKWKNPLTPKVLNSIKEQWGIVGALYDLLNYRREKRGYLD
jgi:hypothetical protein